MTPGAGAVFGSVGEAITAYQTEQVSLLAPIKCRVDYVNDDETPEHRVIDCTVGRLFLNEILPPRLRYRPDFISKAMKQDDIGNMVSPATASTAPSGRSSCSTSARRSASASRRSRGRRSP